MEEGVGGPLRSGCRRGDPQFDEAKLAVRELAPCMNLRVARSVDIAIVAKADGYDALYLDR
jgi:hypothetical protein